VLVLVLRFGCSLDMAAANVSARWQPATTGLHLAVDWLRLHCRRDRMIAVAELRARSRTIAADRR